jgi:hypothetical protein
MKPATSYTAALAVLILSICCPLFSLSSGKKTDSGKTDSLSDEGHGNGQPVSDIALDIAGFSISGKDLLRSGYDWFDYDIIRDIPFFFIALPAISARISSPRPAGGKKEKMQLFSSGYTAGASLTPVGIGTDAGVFCSITPLLTFSASAKVQTGWNYGSSFITIGTYNPEQKEYDSCTSLSELAYTIKTSAMLTIPAGNYMMQLGYSPELTGFTGAGDGQPWKCGIGQDSVNGWKYNAFISVLRILNKEKIKMAGITLAADGWYSSSYFDSVYEPYNPGFVTFTVTPMIRIQPAKKQNLMIMAVFARERKFENENYDTNETLMQNYTGAQWQFKTCMFLWHIKLN